MNRAIKYRIYPNKDQADLFSKTFGCCRKIWNLMLADREAAYRRDGSVFLPRPAMYKDRYPFLREVDSLALANVQLQLQQAYKNYFTVKGVEDNINLNESRAAFIEGREPRVFEHIYPHAFRHTFATRCFEKGLDPLVIQNIMGHANYSTTVSYTHVLEDKTNEAVLKAGDLLA